jgi:glyoxylase I family protein
MPVGTRNQIIQGGGLHHIALQARDWEQSLQFYRDMLGMDVALEFADGDPPRKVALLDMGDGSLIELFEPRPTSPKPGSPAPNDPVIHFALVTTDLHAALERVRQAGYEITLEPESLSLAGKMNVTIAFFKGPNGEEIEFFQVND